MKVLTTHSIQATRDELTEYMLSEAYRGDLIAAIDFLAAIEERSREERENHLVRELRYAASTAGKIPSFLKRYQDRAPEFVYWIQREEWRLDEGAMTYRIVAEIPDSWQRYYTQRGEVLLREDLAAGRTTLESSLSYTVDVFGLKRLIERAARAEVEALLDKQGQVAMARFATR